MYQKVHCTTGLVRGYVVFDCEQEYYYTWLVVITIPVLYNLFIVIARRCATEGSDDS